MFDLIVAVIAVALLSAAAFAAGRTVGLRARPRTAMLCLIAVAAFTAAFFVFVQGTLTPARWIPFAGIVLLANAIPPGAAYFAGAVSARRDLSKRRRVALCAALLLTAGFALVRPLLRTPPPVREHWTRDGVALQSSSASCSPCAAATLLRHYGVESGEEELVALCLTNRRGTTAPGLYRGLKLTTRNTPWDVEVIESDVDALLAEDRWPALLLVKLPRDADVDPRYEREWGWTPGVGHAVVLFGRVGADRLDVGDPAVGREQWTVDDLRVLWQGRGLRLVER